MSDSPWLTKTIHELGGGKASTVQTGPFGSQLHAEDYVEEGVPFILIRNIGDSGLKANDLPRISFSDAKRLAKYSLNPGDIVFSRVGRTGSCLLATDSEAGWIISGQTLRLRLDSPELDSHFLLYALRSHAVQNFVSKSSVGTTRESLNTKILQSIPVLHPRYREQKRIAEILSTLDGAIEQTEALIAKYQQIKAGLMHDLFTRGVTPDGHLRPARAQAPHLYKESPLGWIPKEWAVSSCAEELNIDSGITLGAHRRPKKTPHPYLRVANVFRDRIVLDDVAQVEAFPGEAETDSLNTFDLLVVEGHANRNEIGRCAMVFNDAEGMLFQNHLFRLRAIRVDPRYALLWLNSSHAQHYWEFNCATSSGLNTINRTKLRGMPIYVPSREEQQLVISASFSCREAEAMNTCYFDKLRQQKQGLMQDLLTGRVRVKVGGSASA